MAASWRNLARPASVWRTIHGYLGAIRWKRGTPIVDRDGLRRFLESRSSFVTQISLYGYLRTRAGLRYPELFSNDDFARAVDAAKWQMWLACLSDLSVYAGGLLARRSRADKPAIASLMGAMLEAILAANQAGNDAAGADRVRTRLAQCDWASVPDDATAFSESPRTLIECAPIVDQLKQLDDAIVRNSVRFRWQQVRRELRRDLDAEAVMASQTPPPGA
ncbi:MAG TPA: hypothetical protein VKA16_07035 [Burkholderiales bacterium]|nr:hypothetical protein [Burkholderiales bacterium]